MAKKKKNVPAVSSTADSRFNATKHGILSRHTVLPWEDAQEYRELHEALIDEYLPSGPTEGYLVEELAGIMWRKQRLRMAEAGTARDSLRQWLAAQVKLEHPNLADTDLFGEKSAAIVKGLEALVDVPPDQAEANLENIEDQLSEEYVENRAQFEEQRDYLKRYRETHDAVQSRVASGASFEKLARYETHLDRKFERTLTMLLRIQEFRNQAVAVGSDNAG